MFPQVLFGIFSPLTNSLPFIREPGTTFFDDIIIHSEVEEVPFTGVGPALSLVDWQALCRGKSVGDVLIPLNRAGRLDVPPGESRRVWVTIPAQEFPPGRYECSLAVKPLATLSRKGAEPEKSVTIRLEVKPLRLTTSPDFAVYNWDYARDESYLRTRAKNMSLFTSADNCAPKVCLNPLNVPKKASKTASRSFRLGVARYRA